MIMFAVGDRELIVILALAPNNHARYSERVLSTCVDSAGRSVHEGETVGGSPLPLTSSSLGWVDSSFDSDPAGE